MDSRDRNPSAILSPEQEAAIKMLTSGCSKRYTALVLGVKQSTISAWIAQHIEFKSRLKEAASYTPADSGKEEAKPTISVELEETKQLGDLVEE